MCYCTCICGAVKKSSEMSSKVSNYFVLCLAFGHITASVVSCSLTVEQNNIAACFRETGVTVASVYIYVVIL